MNSLYDDLEDADSFWPPEYFQCDFYPERTQRLNHQDAQVRCEAANDLLSVMRDVDAAFERAGVDAMVEAWNEFSWKIGRRQTAPHPYLELQDALNQPEAKVREAAATVLSHLPMEGHAAVDGRRTCFDDAIPIIARALTDSHLHVRVQICEYLWGYLFYARNEYPDTFSYEPLAPLLAPLALNVHHADKEVFAAAWKALDEVCNHLAQAPAPCEVHSQDVVEALLRAFPPLTSELREAIALFQPEFFDYYHPQNSDYGMCEALLWALSNQHEVADWVGDHLEDKDEQIREVARCVLEWLQRYSKDESDSDSE